MRLTIISCVLISCTSSLNQDDYEKIDRDVQTNNISVFLDGHAVQEKDICGNDSVSLEKFCIDKYEAPNVKGEFPFYAQSVEMAENWCSSKGKYVCTEDQWVSACRGKNKNQYPYGKFYKKSVCNDDKLWRLVNWSLMSSPKWDAHAASLFQGERSGNRENCKTEEDVYDMTGNVAEWVRSSRSPNGYVVKGCYWSGCYGGTPPSCDFVNPAHSPNFRSYEFGFRCCKDAK